MNKASRQHRAPSQQPWPLLALDDASYGAMAAETKERIVWDRIVNDDAPGSEPWKWLENVRNFSLYTKQVGGFRVLSTGVVKGSVHEVATLLAASSQQAFTQKMAALHDKEFKEGTYIADIVPGDEQPEASSSMSDYKLSMRSATFAKSSGWRRREEEWSFLEATQYDEAAPRFERLLTTVQSLDTLVGLESRTSRKGNSTRSGEAIVGYLVEHPAATDATAQLHRNSVRVHFYAELPAPSRSPFGRFSLSSSNRSAAASPQQPRLLQMAKDCDRLAQLVRRRRLGIQVLIDQRRVLPALNAPCVKCTRNLLIAKQCRVCGHSVCTDCSDKYERETHIRNHFKGGLMTKRLETIRVCDPCLDRVESGVYTCMSDKALVGPAVFPDPISKDGTTRSAGTDLKRLLQDALLETQSPQRKSAVLNVIRCVLDQEKTTTEDESRTQSSSVASEKPRRKTTLLSEPRPLDDGELKALDNLVLHNTPYNEAPIAGHEGRSYVLTPDYRTSYTVTQNEAERVEALKDLQVLTAAPCDELDIICDMAAKEVGVFASIVSIITEDEMRVVAANKPDFKAITAERAHSFCTHTIMDDKPLIIPNPEADVRVSYTKVATTIGARFYCGFPLVTDGDKVLGTLCCLDQEKHDLTESQYTAMEKLASTAAKIIKVRGDQQRRAGRAASSA